MRHDKLEEYLLEAEQPVKNFMAELIEALGHQVTKEEEPKINLQYFGADIEIKLLAFDGVYGRNNKTKKA